MLGAESKYCLYRRQHSEARFIPSMLPFGWAIDSSGRAGFAPTWGQLSVPLVRNPPLSRYRVCSADNRSYDPDFEPWQLGKLSALREIALAVEGHYRYYYMG